MEAFFNKFLRMTPEMLCRQLPVAEILQERHEAQGVVFKVRSMEDLMETGIVICGSPDTVRDRLEYCQREAGVGVLGMFQIASMPPEMTVGSMKRFTEHVMPAAEQFGVSMSSCC